MDRGSSPVVRLIFILLAFVGLVISATAVFAHPEDGEFSEEEMISACKAATKAQLSVVNQGNAKKDAFLADCRQRTNGSAWCGQLIRPNPDSIEIFRCTYGANQVHQLINPNATTWVNAYNAVRLVTDLEKAGVEVCQIYNWWRPEPYNANVAGAAGRHPFGTSVDVRFCSKADQEKGFAKLCAWRKAGRLKAVGYYSTTALHFGVGDKMANTWGKDCP